MRRLQQLAAAVSLTAALSACVATPEQQERRAMRGSDILLGGRVSGADLEGRIAAAQAFPLGSRENPVRVSMPEGQRAYLARLRCTDGKAPTFERTGNLGPGVYGSIVDNYAVVCAGNPPTEFNIVMDMYHGRHIENAAPPGFTITP